MKRKRMNSSSDLGRYLEKAALRGNFMRLWLNVSEPFYQY